MSAAAAARGPCPGGLCVCVCMSAAARVRTSQLLMPPLSRGLIVMLAADGGLVCLLMCACACARVFVLLRACVCVCVCALVCVRARARQGITPYDWRDSDGTVRHDPARLGAGLVARGKHLLSVTSPARAARAYRRLQVRPAGPAGVCVSVGGDGGRSGRDVETMNRRVGGWVGGWGVG